jgi:hypothetical protein
MSEVTKDDLIQIATKMAQELQDIISDAENAGCKNPFPGTQLLVDEWEGIFMRTDSCWVKALVESGDEKQELKL